MAGHDEPLWTLGDVAKHLQVSQKTVRRLADEDADFPHPILVRGQERWLPRDFRAWEQVQKIKAKLLAQLGTPLDRSGQSGTNAPGDRLDDLHRRGSR